MKAKIKENFLFIISLILLCISGMVYAQNAKALGGDCKSCGGPADGGECYEVNAGGIACLFDTSGACHTSGNDCC